MEDGKVEGAELKKLVLLSKKKRLNFAFCPGPRDDHTIVIDKKKKPKPLSMVAKNIGPGKKVAFGTFVLNKKTLELTCEKALPKMAKDLQKYLRKQKVLVNVLVMDESGNTLESEEDELPDDPALTEEKTEPATAVDQGGATGQPATETTALAERIKSLLPLIAAMSGGNADKMNKAKARAIAQIKAGDLAGAEQTISAMEGASAKHRETTNDESAEPATEKSGTPQVKELVESANNLRDKIRNIGGSAGEKLNGALGNVAKLIKAGDLMGASALLQRVVAATEKAADSVVSGDKAAPTPAADNWNKANAKLTPLIEKLMQAGQGDLAGINRAFNFAREQAASGNFDKAMAAVARVVDLVKQAQAADRTSATQEAQDAVPDNTVAYTKTRLGWMSTRAGLRKELEDLKTSIDLATADVEGLEDVPANSGTMLEHLEGIDTALEDTLDKLVNASEHDQRDDLKSAARKIIEQYRGVLDSDFFQAVDSNGFAKTNIRAAALNSLQEVRMALET